MLEEMLKRFLCFRSSTTFIKILSFHRRSLNGTTQILNFAIQKNLVISKITFLNLLDPNQTVSFNCCNLKRIRLITRLRLELSQLRKHKFKYNFQNCLNPLCCCGLSIESTSHFLLHCPLFNDKRHTLLSTLNNIDSKILKSNDSYLTQFLLFGSISFNSAKNTFVLNANIDYIFYPLKDSKNLFLKNLVFSYAFYLILSDQLFF